MKNFFKILPLLIAAIVAGCHSNSEKYMVMDLQGLHNPDTTSIWLTHEHILVDFIGADSIQPASWNHDSIIRRIMPYLDDLKKFKVQYFVDATPDYLGRDVKLLHEIAAKTGIRIVTNTGLYGARNDKFIPEFAKTSTAEELASLWISEFQNGIDGTSVKPGFIKIGIDNNDTLSPMHQKLVKAAAIVHLETGLVIASHTGQAIGLWPQLKILEEEGVSPEAFIWVHAQAEENMENYIKAAKAGCWISLDGMGWEMDKHIENLVFVKKNGILGRVLISHDAGWYDPQKKIQDIKPFTAIFEKLYPALKAKGFTDKEWNMLVSENPAKAFSIRKIK